MDDNTNPHTNQTTTAQQELIADKKLAAEKKAAERKVHYNLVVKIINWRSDGLTGDSKKNLQKITKKEWKDYCDQTLSIAPADGLPKAKQQLEATKEAIKSRGGFDF